MGTEDESGGQGLWEPRVGTETGRHHGASPAQVPSKHGVSHSGLIAPCTPSASRTGGQDRPHIWFGLGHEPEVGLSFELEPKPEVGLSLL